MSARHPTLLTPAGYAFSIWGVIFGGLVLYTVWQALPRQRYAALAAALTPPLTLAVLATTTWTLVFSYEQLGASMLVMLLLLAALSWAYARARPLILAGTVPGWPAWFLSLYLGWILLATVLNLTLGLRDALGWQLPKPAVLPANLLLALLAAGIALRLAWRGRDPLLPLPLPVAWGLLGTWVAWHGPLPDAVYTGLGAGAGVALVMPIMAWLEHRRRQRAAR